MEFRSPPEFVEKHGSYGFSVLIRRRIGLSFIFFCSEIERALSHPLLPKKADCRRSEKTKYGTLFVLESAALQSKALSGLGVATLPDIASSSVDRQLYPVDPRQDQLV